MTDELTDDEAAVMLGVALGGVVDVMPYHSPVFMLGDRDVTEIMHTLQRRRLIDWRAEVNPVWYALWSVPFIRKSKGDLPDPEDEL